MLTAIESASPVPIQQAAAWLSAVIGQPGCEPIQIVDACGRVLADALRSPCAWPATHIAAVAGLAVASACVQDASCYAPVPLTVAIPVTAGEPLPAATDAVMTMDAVQRAASGYEALAPVACDNGVVRQGSELLAGDPLLPARHRLRPHDVAQLMAMGVTQLAVVRRLRIAISAADPATALLLRLLCEQAGAIACAADPADLIVTMGIPAPADAMAVAIQPGGDVTLMRSDGVPSIGLPPGPLGCLAAFDMLLAPVLLAHAGLSDVARTDVVLARKIVSGLGSTDYVRVRCRDGQAMPLGTAEAVGLASAVLADGYVIMPESSEGAASGSVVTVFAYASGWPG